MVDSCQNTKISTVLQCYLKKDLARFRFFRKINKLDKWYFGLLVAIYQTPKGENMRWTGWLLSQNKKVPKFKRQMSSRVAAVIAVACLLQGLSYFSFT
jgi:hypothetical protein